MRRALGPVVAAVLAITACALGIAVSFPADSYGDGTTAIAVLDAGPETDLAELGERIDGGSREPVRMAYDVNPGVERTSMQLDGHRSAPQAIGNTADDWWRVSNVGRNRAGTLVPESIDLSVAGQKFTVHPNATKHIAEYATSHGSGSVPISSLAGSVESAVRGGLESGRNFIRAGSWELGIDTRGNVIYHAVYRP